MPWVHDLDLHLGYQFLQTKTQNISITADIFNLLNLHAVIRRGQSTRCARSSRSPRMPRLRS